MGKHSKVKESKISFIGATGTIFAGVLAIGALFIGGLVTGLIPNFVNPPNAVEQPVIPDTKHKADELTGSSTASVTTSTVLLVPEQPPSTQEPPRGTEPSLPPIVVPPVDVEIDARVPDVVEAETDLDLLPRGLDLDLDIDVPLLGTVKDTTKTVLDGLHDLLGK